MTGASTMQYLYMKLIAWLEVTMYIKRCCHAIRNNSKLLRFLIPRYVCLLFWCVIVLYSLNCSLVGSETYSHYLMEATRVYIMAIVIFLPDFSPLHYLKSRYSPAVIPIALPKPLIWYSLKTAAWYFKLICYWMDVIRS